MINRGDIVILGIDDNRYTIYLMYDHHLGVTATIWGIKAEDIANKIKQNGFRYCVVIRPQKSLTWQKKCEFSSYILELLSGKKKLTFKERCNFLQFVVDLYNKIFHVEIVKFPIPITLNNVLLSKDIDILTIENQLEIENQIMEEY